MKGLKTGRVLMIAAALMYLVKVLYFGYNEVATCDLEIYSDILIKIVAFTGIVFYLSLLNDIYEKLAEFNDSGEVAINIDFEKISEEIKKSISELDIHEKN